MKKLSVLFVSACAVSVLVASNAGAVPTSPATTVSPVNSAAVANRGGILAQFQATVKGTIKVPAALAAKIPGLECGNITLTAYSQDQKVNVPGQIFTVSKWTHHATATGTWSSGVCAYSLNVVPNSNYALNIDGSVIPNGGPQCFMVYVLATPQQVGYSKVAPGLTKEQDFTVTDTGCVHTPT
jgi:hypothetical protein